MSTDEQSFEDEWEEEVEAQPPRELIND